MTTQGWGGHDPWQQAMHDVQASYRSARLRYDGPDERADDTVTASQVRPHVARSAIVLLVTFGIALVLSCCSCFSLFSVSSQAEDPFEAAGTASASVLVIPSIFGLGFIVWVVSLFFPLKEPIAEYSMLIEARAPAAPAAYGFILQSAHLRATPFPMAPTRIAGQYMLSIGDKRVQSMIVVQTYGADLYFGWTMWRSRSTIVLIGHALRDMVRLMAGGSTFRSAIMGGRIRALREITHSVTRMGVQAAILNMAATAETHRLVEAVPEGEALPGIAPPAIAPVQPPAAASTSAPPAHTTGGWSQQPPTSAPPYSDPSGGYRDGQSQYPPPNQ